MMRDGLRKWWHLVASPKGRTGRAGFWLGVLSVYAISFVLRLPLEILNEEGHAAAPVRTTITVCELIIDLITTASFLIVAVKRYHDRDKAAWWLLILCLPGLGTLLFLLECGFIPGTPGRNRYDLTEDLDKDIVAVFAAPPARATGDATSLVASDRRATERDGPSSNRIASN